MNTLSRFPPSFEGNPWSFGFALFSLTLISALSMSLLLHYAFEARRFYHINRLLDNMVPNPSPPLPWTVLAFRCVVCGFLMTIVFGALPDVLIMLAWGESSVGTMDALFLIDQVFDGMTLLPFIVAVAFWAWGVQSHEQLLGYRNEAALPEFNLAVFKQNAKTIFFVLIIAVGVTIGKASV